MAVAVQLDDAQRVAGFVEPGSEVAVFATVDNDGTTETNLMLPRATVAAVGVSGMGPCVQLTDADNTPTTKSALYGVDMRATAEIDELEAEF